MQNKILKKSIFSFIDNLIDSFYNKDYLDKFIKNTFFDGSNNLIFNISPVKFNIFIPSTRINFCDDSFLIPETNWIITILIGNTD